MPKTPPPDEAGLVGWILKNRPDLIENDPKWVSQFPDLFTDPDQDPTKTLQMKKFAHYEHGVFEAWVRAMLDDDYLFTGDVIPESRNVFGRGTSRTDYAIEAHGCGLFARDRARAANGYTLVGGFSRRVKQFYVHEGRAGHLAYNIGLGTSWSDALMERLHLWPLDGHPKYHAFDKLELLQKSESGNLTLEQFQLGDLVAALNLPLFFGLATLHSWWFSNFLTKVWERGLKEAREDLDQHGYFGSDQLPQPDISDRVFFMRWARSMKPEEIEKLTRLPFGYPPGYEFLTEALEIAEASDIL